MPEIVLDVGTRPTEGDERTRKLWLYDDATDASRKPQTRNLAGVTGYRSEDCVLHFRSSYALRSFALTFLVFTPNNRLARVPPVGLSGWLPFERSFFFGVDFRIPDLSRMLFISKSTDSTGDLITFNY